MTTRRFRGTQRELYELGRERRGRPRRGNVKVSCRLSIPVHQKLGHLTELFPQLQATRSELVGLGIALLGIRLDKVAAAVGRSDLILPAGVIDLEALYLIWDLKYPDDETMRTTVYLLPEQTLRLGETRSRLRLQIRVNQDDLINLAINLLDKLVQQALRGQGAPVIRDTDDLMDYLHQFV